MSKNEFPIYLAEVEVAQYFGFHFCLPKKDIGRSDVIICVEYECLSKNIVRYHVWAQLKDTFVRAYLCSATLPGSVKTGDIVPKIMFDLNSNEGFYEQVHSFIDHFGSAAL